MKINVEKIIEEYGMDYITAGNLDVRRMTEISFNDSMNLPGRGICIDREQDIYSNDLPLDERKKSLLTIFSN